MYKLHITLLTAVFAVSAIGCGGKNNGDNDGAFLSVVGDKNVFIDNDDVQKLSVRYHDGNDRPLQGQVDFRIIGTTGGATLNKSSGLTNTDGVVEIHLTAGTSGSASFQIEAEADSSSPARWTVSVGGAVPDLDPSGRYELSSKLDIVSGLDNTVGDVLNTFIDMTDDENDPAKWVLDLAMDELASQGGLWENIANAVNLIRGVIDPAVNDLILENAPGFVTDVLAVGEMLGDVTRNFGVTSVFDIKKNGNGDVDSLNYSATHEITGVFFEIQGSNYAWNYGDFNAGAIVAEDIPVSKDSANMVVIGNHDMPLTYGAAIVLVLEEVIIPLVDDEADDLASFLQNRVNCENVGVVVEDKVGVGTPALFEGVCEFALEAGAALVIDKILDIDNGGLTLDIAGLARPRDTNGDRKVDNLQSGKWSGFIEYVSVPAAMDPENNTFTGVRMTSTQ